MPADSAREERSGVVLVLYYADRAPLRTAISDHLYAVARYSRRPCLYVNLAVRSVPGWVRRLPVDLVVFHTILLAQRWQPELFERLMSKLEPIRHLETAKVAIPQDEFIQTDILCSFLREFRVDHVLSCAPESLWPTIYDGLADDPPTFTRVLTGYIEPATTRRIAALAATAGSRAIDIGYRAWRPEPWLGRHGQLKGLVAEMAEQQGPGLGLRIDASLRDEDTLVGDDWYRFLLNSRWTIGAEGGSSILDRDGSIRARTRAFMASRPDATFEEIEAACFPGIDGAFALYAISPRHLEACMTRTAQILVVGEYNGILTPGDHYLPLQRDLSNLEAVLALAKGDQTRDEIARRAYEDIVASRRYEYPAFVHEVVSAISVDRPRRPAGLVERLILGWERRLDKPSWGWVRVRLGIRYAVSVALRRTGLLEPLRGLRGHVRPRTAGR